MLQLFGVCEFSGARGCRRERQWRGNVLPAEGLISASAISAAAAEAYLIGDEQRGC